jgi:uncharacterized membrane protein YphA (DoxX/SURF4 family)
MRKYNFLPWTVTFVRIIIGWHFFYEGIVKLFSSTWTAAPYLSGSRWIFGGLFQAIVNNNVLMSITDTLNVLGLTFIGLALILGVYTRLASFCGALLMLLYFIAYPPFLGFMQGIAAEGSYLWVNRNLIELLVLLALGLTPDGYMYGLDRLIKAWKDSKIHKPVPATDGPNDTGLVTAGVNRRDAIRDLVSIPVLGAFAYAVYRKKKFNSWEEKFLAQGAKTDATSGATLMSFEFTSLKSLKAPCPRGKIGNIDLSRLIAGGNLIGGWAHSRDLLYVSKLVKAYHNDDKVIQTLSIAEKCGINALLCNPSLARIIHKYWNETDGKIHFISDCQLGLDFIAGAKMSVDLKASAAYCGGEMTDRFAAAGKFDIIRQGLDIIRAAGIPAGIGAHKIEAIEACVKEGIIPDFWMKTIHSWNYWSSMVGEPGKEWMDNRFDYNPDRTIEFMNTLGQPWIGFKVLAAGAIKPEEGFKYAYENGADFITVGMYDFQIVDDVNLVNDILPQVQNRKRPWCG